MEYENGYVYELMDKGGPTKVTEPYFKATPHNPRLTPLHVICLPAFRHITQILLDLRQQACVEFRQSDENLDGASDAQGSCGVALITLFCFAG